MPQAPSDPAALGSLAEAAAEEVGTLRQGVANKTPGDGEPAAAGSRAELHAALPAQAALDMDDEDPALVPYIEELVGALRLREGLPWAGAFYCRICDMWLNGPQQWIDHTHGSKHRKRRRAAGIPRGGEQDRPAEIQAVAVKWRAHTGGVSQGGEARVSHGSSGQPTNARPRLRKKFSFSKAPAYDF